MPTISLTAEPTTLSEPTTLGMHSVLRQVMVNPDLAQGEIWAVSRRDVRAALRTDRVNNPAILEPLNITTESGTIEPVGQNAPAGKHYVLSVPLPIDSIVNRIRDIQNNNEQAHNSVWFLEHDRVFLSGSSHDGSGCSYGLSCTLLSTPRQNFRPLPEMAFRLAHYTSDRTGENFYLFIPIDMGNNGFPHILPYIADVLTNRVNLALGLERSPAVHSVLAQRLFVHGIMGYSGNLPTFDTHWRRSVTGRVSARSRFPVSNPGESWEIVSPQLAPSMNRIVLETGPAGHGQPARAPRNFQEVTDWITTSGQDEEPAITRGPAPRVLDHNGMVPAVIPTAKSHAELFPSEIESTPWVEEFSVFKSVYSAVAGKEHPTPMSKLPDTFSHALPFRADLDQYVPLTFGLEIEIDFPDEDTYDLGSSKRSLVDILYAAQLAFQPSSAQDPNRWHQAGRRTNPDGSVGYSTARNGWSVEYDRSVDSVNGARGCEIVSPVMYNTLEAWEDIREVLDIIRNLGGKTTVRTGLHVNIGTQQYNTTASVANMADLLTLNAQFDDVIVRLAHTPEIGQIHRGRSYCGPSRPVFRSRDPLYQRTQDDNISLANLASNNGHRSSINFENAQATNTNRNTGRLEFRIFDGTLELGRIQANVMLAMAMTRATGPTEFSTWDKELGAQPSGTHVSRRAGANRQARRLSGAAWEENTLRFRQLLASLQLTPEEATPLVTMYRASRWMIN